MNKEEVIEMLKQVYADLEDIATEEDKAMMLKQLDKEIKELEEGEAK